MSSDLTPIPESPPAAPLVPVGLGTKLGVLGTAVLGVVAVLGAVLEGDHAPETGSARRPKRGVERS